MPSAQGERSRQTLQYISGQPQGPPAWAECQRQKLLLLVCHGWMQMNLDALHSKLQDWRNLLARNTWAQTD